MDRVDLRMLQGNTSTLESRSALRRLGVNITQVPEDLLILQAYDGRKVLCDWWLKPLIFRIERGLEFHTNVDMHLTPQDKMTVFRKGLDFMFNPSYGNADILQTYLYEDYVGRAAREAMEATGARHMLRALGFRKTIAVSIPCSDRVKRVYQLTRKEYQDASRAIRIGRSFGGGHGECRAVCQEAAPASYSAG